MRSGPNRGILMAIAKAAWSPTPLGGLPAIVAPALTYPEGRGFSLLAHQPETLCVPTKAMPQCFHGFLSYGTRRRMI